MDEVNLVGEKFGELTVIALNNTCYRGSSWICECSCGNRLVLSTCRLLGTKARCPNKSCGCEHDKQNGETVKNPKLYTAWNDILVRCYNAEDERYKHYGAKGIAVCDEWKNNFQSFVNWSLDNGFKEGLFLSRKDTTKSYEPDNCLWSNTFEPMHRRGIYKNNTTGYTGITYNTESGYRAYITRYHKRYYLGSFDTLEEAVEARKIAEEKFKKLITEYNGKRINS